MLILLMALWLASVAGARAQSSAAFAYVTNVRVTQLANAVRLTIEADGTIEIQRDNQLVYQFIDFTPRPHLTAVREVHLRLLNCRSRLGSFKNVGLYPVDHLEFAVPEDSQNGVGLDVKISLDEDASAGKVFDVFDRGESGQPTISMAQSPDQRSIIVTVTSDQFPEKTPVRKRPDAAGEHSLSVTPLADGLVDVVATNEPLSSVVRRLAAVSGLSAAIEPSAERVISAALRQRPETLLVTLAEAYGLSFSIVDGVLLMRAPESDAGGATSLPLRYLDAQRAVSLLPTFLLHYTHPDSTRNAVVVTGSPALRAKISADLERLDVPSPECRVAVTFVTYTKTDDYEQTLEMARRTSSSNVEIAAGAAGAPSGTLVYSHEPHVPGIDAELTALNEDSDLHIQARPELLLSNGQKGSIFDGATYLIPNNSYYRGRLDNVQVGTSVDVTPLMGEDGPITLQITTSSSDAASRDPGSGLPVIETRQVDGTLRIRSGDTIYIGGLSELQRVTTRFRIPILSDIPVIGALFRGRRSHRQRVQIAVFVTATRSP